MMNYQDDVREILEDMFSVSEKANPNNFATSGNITWKRFIDAKFGEPKTAEDFEDIAEEIFFDDEISIEEMKNIYNDPEILNFWVYDRYNDGSFIMYTIYGDEESKYGTYEIITNEIFNF